MRGRIRLYAYGITAAAAFGILAIVAGVLWVRSAAVSTAEEARWDRAADSAADVAFSVLDDHVRRTGRPQWARIGEIGPEDVGDFPIDEIRKAAENVVGAAVRAASGGPSAPVFATDPAFAARGAFLRAPPEPGRVRLSIDTDGRTAIAAFRLPKTARPDEGVDVNLHLRAPIEAVAWAGFERRTMFGGLILGVVIYFLGAFAYLLREFGENLASKEREKSTRLRAVRDVAAGIAHELRNPLNAIGLSVQVIERKIPKTGALDPSMERQFERVHMEIGRIKKVVDAFVRFARLGDLTVADFDLSDAVRETARTFEAIFAERGVEATLDVQDGVRVVGDREKLSEALAAVVQSAVEALSSGGGALRLSLVAQRREAKIVVRDTGPSLDDERLRNVFEPYRTGRDHGGFGLTLAKTIVESHGGAVDAASPEGGGCEVTLTLPRRPRRFD